MTWTGIRLRQEGGQGGRGSGGEDNTERGSHWRGPSTTHPSLPIITRVVVLAPTSMSDAQMWSMSADETAAAALTSVHHPEQSDAILSVGMGTYVAERLNVSASAGDLGASEMRAAGLCIMGAAGLFLQTLGPFEEGFFFTTAFILLSVPSSSVFAFSAVAFFILGVFIAFILVVCPAEPVAIAFCIGG